MPIAPNQVLRWPTTGLYSQRNSTPATALLMTTGTKIKVRCSQERRRTGYDSSKAIATAMAIPTGTVPIMKNSDTRTLFQNSPLPSSRV